MAAPAPASALPGRRKAPGWESPKQGHQGLAQGGRKQETSVQHPPGGTGFTGRHPPELGACRGHLGEPRCAGEGSPHPTGSRRWVPQPYGGFSRVRMEFPARPERSGALERAGCRCHSWVIQEINWGLGQETASKGTLGPALPPAPARGRCQTPREMLLGRGGGDTQHPSHRHPQRSSIPERVLPGPAPRHLLVKNQKSNQMTALGWVSPSRRMEAALPGLGSAATHPGTAASPAPAPGGDGAVPLPASVSPFLHLSLFLLEHWGHADPRGLDSASARRHNYPLKHEESH